MKPSAVKWTRSLLLTIVVPALVAPIAFSQQEVDPTWYDPWDTPRQVVVEPSPLRASSPKPKPKSVRSTSLRTGVV